MSHADAAKMPGHWVLAKLGKRVLRPGGIELTRKMLAALNIGAEDDVIEFAPGLGATAKLTLARSPASYIAVERDETAAGIVRRYLSGSTQRCILASAQDTGLADQSSDVVYGEAMLSMQTDALRAQIVREASRLLRDGGRYGIHEMRLLPDDIDPHIRHEIETGLTRAVHHRVAPLTTSEWRRLLAKEGLGVCEVFTTPMHLLEPARLVADEGLGGALRFGWNVLRNPDARKRVLAMRNVFRRFSKNIGAVAFVAVKDRTTEDGAYGSGA